MDIMKYVARTIEIDVSPQQFVFRYKDRERCPSTKGYLTRVKNLIPSFDFHEEPQGNDDIPIDLSQGLPAEIQEDVIHVLAALIRCGIAPLSTPIRPFLVLGGIERFDTGWGFEYAAFKEAAKIFALRDKEVQIRR